MKDFEKRIKALEYAIERKEAEKRAHEPMVLYRPRNLMRDEQFLIYYPEGRFRPPVTFGPITYEETSKLISAYPADTLLQISMGECTEWLFAFHHFSEHAQLYTQEQIERFKEKELQITPELAYMVSVEGTEMLRIMLQLPQVFFVRMRDFRQAINTLL